MNIPRTKTIAKMEERMGELNEDSLRYKVLQSARRFKTSWIELGQYLQTVWRDKHYREWGYTGFDLYCSRELAVKHATALKLLRSYYFLEREEPAFLKAKLVDSGKVVKLPSCDSVDILRLARDKKDLREEDYRTLRYRVLEKGDEAKEVRSKLRSILSTYSEVNSEVEQRRKQTATISRFLGTLKTFKREIESSDILSKSIVKDVEHLIEKIEEGLLRQGPAERK